MADTPAEFSVVAGAGSLRPGSASGWTVPHDWTPDGVVVAGDGNGAAVLHLSVALCVLNDTFREGEALGVPVAGVRVRAGGTFDRESWVSTGIVYSVEVDSSAPSEDVAKVLERVDEVAEIPRVLRAGMTVERSDG
jgi:OsmC-like protein